MLGRCGCDWLLEAAEVLLRAVLGRRGCVLRGGVLGRGGCVLRGGVLGREICMLHLS